MRTFLCAAAVSITFGCGTADTGRSSLESHAGRVVAFLRGQVPADSVAFADSVTLYVAPEGGGSSRVMTGPALRDPAEWVVESPPARYEFTPPRDHTDATYKARTHFNCLEYTLDSRYPALAQFPHVAVQLRRPGQTGCLTVWNVTFVFDDVATPRLIAAVYDQWEW